jgi:outer membrane protein insertion porin family
LATGEESTLIFGQCSAACAGAQTGLAWGRALALAFFLMVVLKGGLPAQSQPLPFDPRASADVGQEPEPADEVSARPAPTALGSIFDYQGLVVDDIEFRGVESGNVSTLRGLLTQKVHEPLERLSIRNSVRALYATGRFSDIQVEADRRPRNQVALVFVATENYFVGLVTVDGIPPELTSNQLINAGKLQLGELYSSDKLQRSIDRMKLLLRENGYYEAAVSSAQDQQPQSQQVNISFHIAPGPQARVGRISVTGNSVRTVAAISAIAHMKPGDRVTAARVNGALQRLRKRYQKQDYLESQISIASRVYLPQNNAVDFTFHIDPGPLVEVRLQGASMSRGLMKKHIPIYQENAVDDDLLNEGRRNLRDYFQQRGYFDVSVDVRQDYESSLDVLYIVFVVERGIRHRVEAVDITGNRYFLESAIRERMKVQTAGRVFSHGLYSASLLADDVNSITTLYKSNGFSQVKVTSSVFDDYRGVKGQLGIKIGIEEGPQQVVGALHLVGLKSISEEEIRSLLSETEGQPYSEYNIANDRDGILGEYFNHGFPNAQFSYGVQAAAKDANQMEVTYTIKEGDEVFVRKVLVSGLEHTRPYVVQQVLEVTPGEPLSQNDMLRSQQRLYDLGIFSQVDTAVQNPDGVDKDKNVLFRMQEAKRYTFTYGVGLEAQTGQPSGPALPQGATGVSPRVSFDLTRLNFRGRAHTISFKSHLGRLEQRALVSYDAQRWLDRDNLRLTFTAFYDNTLDVLTFTSKRLEGSVQAEQTVSKATTLLYRFTYRRVQATNLVIEPQLVPLLSQPVRVGMPTFTYIRDQRDNPLETTKGQYNTLDAGVAGSFFGSQANFSRVLAQNSTYHLFHKKFVFARSTRVGVENLFGNNTISPGLCPVGITAPGSCEIIPLPERFLAGGGNSLRAFALNQAGPRDQFSGAPLGGEALFINNLEMRFPPVYMPFVEDNMSFVVFHDAGNVFSTPNDMVKGLGRLSQDTSGCETLTPSAVCNFNYIAQAVGAGVRYKTPIGPVRLDFGYNLNPPTFPVLKGDQINPYPHIETARRFNFFFSIGQTF